MEAAGGLVQPARPGSNAYQPLASDIQTRPAGHPGRDRPKVGAKYSPDLANLLVAEQKLVPAQRTSPSEWKRWWGVCLARPGVFAVLVFFMRGRWSPRAARRDFEEHERLVSDELAKLASEQVAVPV